MGFGARKDGNERLRFIRSLCINWPIPFCQSGSSLSRFGVGMCKTSNICSSMMEWDRRTDTSGNRSRKPGLGEHKIETR